MYVKTAGDKKQRDWIDKSNLMNNIRSFKVSDNLLAEHFVAAAEG